MESKKTEKSKISKNSRRHHASSGSREWRQVAYQHRHDVNERIRERMRSAKSAMKSGKTKKARRRLEEGAELLSKRQEWLAVVDANGVHVANDGTKH